MIHHAVDLNYKHSCFINYDLAVNDQLFIGLNSHQETKEGDKELH